MSMCPWQTECLVLFINILCHCTLFSSLMSMLYCVRYLIWEYTLYHIKILDLPDMIDHTFPKLQTVATSYLRYCMFISHFAYSRHQFNYDLQTFLSDYFCHPGLESVKWSVCLYLISALWWSQFFFAAGDYFYDMHLTHFLIDFIYIKTCLEILDDLIFSQSFKHQKSLYNYILITGYWVFFHNSVVVFPDVMDIRKLLPVLKTSDISD